MNIVDWWDCNARYVKAYAAFIVMLLAVRMVFWFLPLHALIAISIEALGISEYAALWVSIVIFGIAFIVVGFYIFRNAVRKFVLHQPIRKQK